HNLSYLLRLRRHSSQAASVNVDLHFTELLLPGRARPCLPCQPASPVQ
ncbi:unnamed protein product, partial [Fusarium graminearum]